jgi:cell volume regulation protein A
MLWLLILDRLTQNEHAYPITLSALLLLYVVVDYLGGSPALGVLAFALVVGNATHIGAHIRLSSETRLDEGLRDFHSQMVFIVKSFFFTYIGAMLGPPWGFAAAGAVLAVVTLVVRFPGAWLALFGLPLSKDLRRIVYVSAPRGVAAGVLAALPFSAGIPGTSGLPIIVFASVFTGILIFSVSFPLVQRRSMNMQIELS